MSSRDARARSRIVDPRRKALKSERKVSRAWPRRSLNPWRPVRRRRPHAVAGGQGEEMRAAAVVIVDRTVPRENDHIAPAIASVYLAAVIERQLVAASGVACRHDGDGLQIADVRFAGDS